MKEDKEQSPVNQATTSFQPSPELWKNIWKLQTPSKVKNFMWCLCQNALPTKDNLFRRKILPDPICPLCTHERETVEHLFLLCPWTSQIWSNPELSSSSVMDNLEGSESGHISRKGTRGIGHPRLCDWNSMAPGVGAIDGLLHKRKLKSVAEQGSEQSLPR